MKKLILSAICAVSVLGATAQVSAYKQGVGAAADGYVLPRTVVTGTVSVEREVLVRGPYARFAAQYLGVTGAPMSDKESYKILGASLSWATEPDPAFSFTVEDKSGALAKVFRWLDPVVVEQPAVAADKDFDGAKIGNIPPFTDLGTSTWVDRSRGGLAVDRTSTVEKSTEQMAADAAAVIFRIRKSRLDLITGESGEYVFGEGLRAAIEEMARLEAEYLSLFVGKRYVQRTTHRFSALPEAGKNRVVAFRFSEAKGFAESSDLSVPAYNLEFKVEEAAAPQLAKRSGKMVLYRIPSVERVTLTNGTETLASERVPVYQKGAVVETPVL